MSGSKISKNRRAGDRQSKPVVPKLVLVALIAVSLDGLATEASGLETVNLALMYDDLVGTFTQNGIVDEETQHNDIEVIRQITKTTEPIPIQRAYDFRFAREADRQLIQSSWRP
jgi:hypothetical protein